MSQITLSKALIKKKKLGAKLQSLYNQLNESCVKIQGEPEFDSQSFAELIIELHATENQLISLSKTIHEANKFITDKLAKLSLLKLQHSKFSGMLWTMRNAQNRLKENQVLIYAMLPSTLSSQIKELDEQIEALKDELALYNSSTMVVVD